MEEQRVVPKKRQDKISMHTSCDSICMYAKSRIQILIYIKRLLRKKKIRPGRNLCVFFSPSCYMLSMSFTVWGGLHLEINEKKVWTN